jgi:hypothetical protein
LRDIVIFCGETVVEGVVVVQSQARTVRENIPSAAKIRVVKIGFIFFLSGSMTLRSNVVRFVRGLCYLIGRTAAFASQLTSTVPFSGAPFSQTRL